MNRLRKLAYYNLGIAYSQRAKAPKWFTIKVRKIIHDAFVSENKSLPLRYNTIIDKYNP